MTNRYAWALLLAAGAAFAQDGAYPNSSNFIEGRPHGGAWLDACMRAAGATMPDADLPAPQARAALAGCEPANLYYDTLSLAEPGQAAWQRVRYCAVVRGDDTVLMMLYANGLGVAKNTAFAINRACRIEAAPAETDARVMHLATGKTYARTGKAFDQCDDITSGYMGGQCAAIAARQAERVRERRFGKLTASWPAAHRAAFSTLFKAYDAFRVARGSEVDMTGTARVAFEIEAEEQEARTFDDDLREFESGTVPAGDEARLMQADARLNAAYRAVLAAKTSDPGHPDRLGDSTILKADVRSAQRAWLRFRDAWVTFAARKYRHVQAAALKTRLTERRTAQLRDLARYGR
jgi:uncharacterized protein YecT (DUF1311 family)